MLVTIIHQGVFQLVKGDDSVWSYCRDRPYQDRIEQNFIKHSILSTTHSYITKNRNIHAIKANSFNVTNRYRNRTI